MTGIDAAQKVAEADPEAVRHAEYHLAISSKKTTRAAVRKLDQDFRADVVP